MRSLNKRGFWMGEEAGKFILGIIAVVLLFMLAFKLVGIMRQNTAYEQAKYTLGEIDKIISSIQEGETKTLFVESPKGWYLMSFSKELGFDRIPNSCGVQNCLCLCPKDNKNDCENKGICKSLQERKMFFVKFNAYEKNLKFEKTPLKLTFKEVENKNIIIYTDEQEITISNELKELINLKATFEEKEYKISELMIKRIKGEPGIFVIIEQEIKTKLNETYGKDKWALRFSKISARDLPATTSGGFIGEWDLYIHEWIYVNHNIWNKPDFRGSNNDKIKNELDERILIDEDSYLIIQLKILK